jgi:hypothetical protein
MGGPSSAGGAKPDESEGKSEGKKLRENEGEYLPLSDVYLSEGAQTEGKYLPVY